MIWQTDLPVGTTGGPMTYMAGGKAIHCRARWGKSLRRGLDRPWASGMIRRIATAAALPICLRYCVRFCRAVRRVLRAAGEQRPDYLPTDVQ
jgi:hypothetical protein